MSAASNRSVAVIGGGISGLVCANRLQQLGITNVTVFDTGKNATGGRCSSRRILVKGNTEIFDHACQYFTVSDQRFAKVISFLHDKKAVKIWKGRIGHLKHGKFQLDSNLTQAFIGTDGMQTVPQCLSDTVAVRRPVWIGDVSWQETCRRWKVDKYGHFDYLVIAHNGKCADKLMSNAGAPDVHSLLRVRFNDTWNPRDGRMHLCSLWVLLVAFETKLNLNFEAAHVTDRNISWISNNTSKYKNEQESRNSIECWTIISTKSFGKAHKVPQENIPPATKKEVIELMLASFKSVIGSTQNLPAVCYTGVQLWGAAVPINVLNNTEECVFDEKHQVGVCGDWLRSPCIQGAAVSGLALAEHIQKHSIGQTAMTSLRSDFKGTMASAIGSFPTDKRFIFNPDK